MLYKLRKEHVPIFNNPPSDDYKVPRTPAGDEYCEQLKTMKKLTKYFLTSEQKEYCTKLGGGNIYSGIRLCIQDRMLKK
jgi:hypothetical protein